MMYAEFVNGILGAQRRPKPIEVKPSDGTRIGRPEGGWQESQLQALGLFPVAEVDRPEDTELVTHTSTVELTAGDPRTNDRRRAAVRQVEQLWDMIKDTPSVPTVGHVLVQLVMLVEQLEAKITELEEET